MLGIETSSARGSIALLDGERVCLVSSYEQQSAHEATLQPLAERALAELGWSLRELDRITVGIGPGSFTGLRVGIAWAQGISEGLGVPLVGVSSLAAMASAAPAGMPGLRVPLIDARRGEFFVAAYSADGRELLAPQIAGTPLAVEQLLSSLPQEPLLLGQAWDPLVSKLTHHASAETDLPHARWIAALGVRLAPGQPVVPAYLRPPVATLPQLERNPLAADAPARRDASAGAGERPER